MFNLTVDQQDVDRLLGMFQEAESPYDLDYMAAVIYDKIDSITTRKVRLCITALQERGFIVYSNDHGYLLAGDDPEPVIHYLNGLYSRAHKLTAKADTLYRELKRKYGDEVAKRVEQLPGQPALGGYFDTSKMPVAIVGYCEPPFHKSYDAKGNEIDA
ncbi:MAG: hypothetical protein WC428_06780 [Candidatus Paceibacterota bacterium]